MEHELGAASESSEAWGGSGAELPLRTEDVHAMYARLGFIIVSGKMSATQTKGEWKKKFAFPRGWQTTESREYDKSGSNASGFALVTGAKSGVTAIDIDDPDTPTNKRLMRLMSDCTLVARTKKGFHYVFKYDVRILQTAGDKLDTRNDGGCIFVAPSVAYDDHGRTVAEYKWVRVPAADADGASGLSGLNGANGSNGLVAVPEPVIEFLRALDRRYVRAAPTTLTAPTAPAPPAAPTPPCAPAGARSQEDAGALAEDEDEPITDCASWAEIEAPRLKETALRYARARAETDNVGFPVRVMREQKMGIVRVEFSKRGTRVCPVSRQEHRSNNFSVLLRVDKRTGLAVLFVHCHSAKDGCSGGHRMLCYLDADDAEEVCAETGIELAEPPRTATTLGQAAVAIGEAQKALDRLLENPHGGWASAKSLCVIACALCTAAARHAPLVDTAALMLDSVLSPSLTAIERKTVKCAFQHARAPLDPLATLRGFAAGLNGKREQELMLVREAIVACTDPALEADVPNAAESLMCVLEFCEQHDECSGKVERLANYSELGMFIFYIWRRVARYGFDDTQSSAAHQWTFYLFNGATYERGQLDRIAMRAERHLCAVIRKLFDSPSLRPRAKATFTRCQSSDYIAKALVKAQMLFKDLELLEACGLVSPEEFERELDMGNYIGFTNGVYDIQSDHFMPKGYVPLNVLVSMCTRYAYVSPDHAKFPEMRAQIEELYRTIHAENYDDPNDERLAAMWLLSGSLLYRGNVCKKAYIFLGSEGDNGKSKFAEFISLTLGKYAVTGSRSSLSGTHDQNTLDPDLVANHKSLVCTFPEVQSFENGTSSGFKFNCAKLKAITGDDPQSGRALYHDKKDLPISFKPIMHTNFMPQVDTDDSAATERLWVARFGSTFPAGITEKDVARRRYPRIDNLRDRMKEWAPFHFLLMLEALRDFIRRNKVLPPGAQHIEGSLMHQVAAALTPEGKLRAWVDANYAPVPIKEKDSGSKLDALYSAYFAAAPPVHAKPLGKILFAKMLTSVCAGVGPHKNSTGSAHVYLLR
jgi:hypothetical protein